MQTGGRVKARGRHDEAGKAEGEKGQRRRLPNGVERDGGEWR